MKIYIAHNYEARHALLKSVVPLLEARGHIVTSKWIKNTSTHDTTDRTAQAVIDLCDIEYAHALLFFCDNFGDRPGRGKYFEFGYAIARQKIVWVVGIDNESCVFYHLPELKERVFTTLEELLVRLDA